MNQTLAGRRLFILDTNVLMHDPTSLFRFHEHDIFLPMIVLEELDRGKKGMSEVARNVRQVSRFIDKLISGANKEQIDTGLPLHIPSINRLTAAAHRGRLFFQTRNLPDLLPDSLPGNIPDNNILGAALALQRDHPDSDVTLVSKDINLRIKAALLGIRVEDYYNDQVLNDASLLYSGMEALPATFWEKHGKDLLSSWEQDNTDYRVEDPDTTHWYANQCLYRDDDSGIEGMAKRHSETAVCITGVKNYRHSKTSVWGIHARNREQNFALNMLMDPELEFVSLLGNAGTGKTLLALAAGLAQTLDENIYQDIIMTRVTVPVGEDIGFLPGTEEEKMTPWMGALTDNLEVLTRTDGSEWGRAVTDDLITSRVHIHSLNFMRGRTFLKKYLILDEAQNLTPKQMKTLVTRAGPGTKIVCIGNIAQIDTPYLTETNSGLTYAVDRFKGWEHSGHITLMRGERSRLADFAAAML